MADYIRVVDIGGDGFRKVDIPVNTEFKVKNTEDQIKKQHIKKKSAKSIRDLNSLTDFVKRGTGKKKIKGIAYSVAGVIDEKHKKIKKSPNAHFLDGVPLANVTKDKTGIRSFVFNDMEAAVTGMHVLLPDERYFMGIT